MPPIGPLLTSLPKGTPEGTDGHVSGGQGLITFPMARVGISSGMTTVANGKV
jgi:hypothetical protein